jgi:hypothetical protein
VSECSETSLYLVNVSKCEEVLGESYEYAHVEMRLKMVEARKP